MFAKAMSVSGVLMLLSGTLSAQAQDAARAVIENSGSTNSEGFSLSVAEDGTALLVQGGSSIEKQLAPALAAHFFADLRAAGPLDALPRRSCVKSVSFGSTTTVTWNGKTSPDLSCPTENPIIRALATDVGALTAVAGAKQVPRGAR